MSADQQHLSLSVPASLRVHAASSRVPKPRRRPPAPVAEYTHTRLLAEARSAAGALDRLGVCPGERVGVLLPMCPESVAMTMACGRLDLLRVTLPWEDSVPPLREAVRRSGAGVLVVADAATQLGRTYEVKRIVDRALADCPAVRSVLVVHRTGGPVPWTPGRDQWWHEALATLEA
ncbi:AMP-binding protein [Streptomyces sp. JJ66]|uniref:AMP-binding protein n=1 Tax=Streptomyces sp. JJ66 TaxID=2803843 RepID=UPI001C592BC3|nr:AMP-binding protein [Streptomyces sp. JJ66]MBW1603938.1 AMP-binding protein [Streptomyces sp. JJ66]